MASDKVPLANLNVFIKERIFCCKTKNKYLL